MQACKLFINRDRLRPSIHMLIHSSCQVDHCQEQVVYSHPTAHLFQPNTFSISSNNK